MLSVWHTGSAKSVARTGPLATLVTVTVPSADLGSVSTLWRYGVAGWPKRLLGEALLFDIQKMPNAIIRNPIPIPPVRRRLLLVGEFAPARVLRGPFGQVETEPGWKSIHHPVWCN